MSVRIRSLPIAIALLTALGLAVDAAAAKLFVANNGTDSSTCGPKPNPPCRSITQAIQNAGDGDKIEVGPGVYGDIDGDGVLGEPGEEPAAQQMILVDRRLTIASQAGAVVTLIDGGGAASVAVNIRADAVVFGGKNKGFTVVGVNSGVFSEADNVKVEGNNVVGLVRTAFSSLGGGQTFTGNVASASGKDGFNIVEISGNHTVSRNLAVLNAENGFLSNGPDDLIAGNAALGNGQWGILVTGDGQRITGNSAVANGFSGIGLFGVGSGQMAVGNTTVGNLQLGIDVSTDNATITKNNIYGNNPGGFCGLRNVGSAVFPAPRNYWGAASGPGLDPADFYCGTGVDPAPFATKPFKTRLKVP